MEKKEIEKLIILEVQKICNKKSEEIELENNLIDDLGMTSLDIMIFLSKIEETFDIEVNLKDLLKLTNLNDFIDYVEQIKNKQ